MLFLQLFVLLFQTYSLNFNSLYMLSTFLFKLLCIKSNPATTTASMLQISVLANKPAQPTVSDKTISLWPRIGGPRNSGRAQQRGLVSASSCWGLSWEGFYLRGWLKTLSPKINPEAFLLSCLQTGLRWDSPPEAYTSCPMCPELPRSRKTSGGQASYMTPPGSQHN